MTRTDMTTRQTILLFAAAPIAALWRAVLLRPVYWYAMATCTRISRWGTREDVEVRSVTRQRVSPAFSRRARG
ncbi:hypothetical protein ACU686_22440 [Yinghuangia aomiensis]